MSRTNLVVADIGGTHARFAIATLDAGRVTDLCDVVTIKTADHASLQSAWADYGEALGRPLPRAAALAVAGTVGGEVVRLTNTGWTIKPALIGQQLGVDALTLVNDFAAVAHAVAGLPAQDLAHLSGPDVELPGQGVITVLGPGTGLGVAYLHRGPGGSVVVQTEASHLDFAPVDAVEDHILAVLRERFGRASAERVVSGPGLAHIHAALAAREGRDVFAMDDAALWSLALTGDDPLATAALDRFCLSLGSVAGDLALAQGAVGVVLAGGLTERIATRLAASGFAQRFLAKGRFEALMATMPVKRLTHPQPGLYGAAQAFVTEH